MLVSGLPWLTGYVRYDDLSLYFANHSEILFAFLAVVGAITLPFQSTIIHEENPHVLAVLSETNVRRVFVRASIFQATLILCLALSLLAMTSNSTPSVVIGYFEILAFSLITFESIALISNGRAYGNFREKIILATNKAIMDNSSPKNDPKDPMLRK